MGLKDPRKLFGLLLAPFLVLGIGLVSPRRVYALSWAQVNTDGFGDSNNWGAICLQVFGDYIYVGISNSTDGGQIWRSQTGELGSWEAVTTDGFGDSENYEFSAFTTFNDYIYVSTVKMDGALAGAEIWRSQTGAAGTWSQVNDSGFGDDGNYGIRALEVLNGYLYAGTENANDGAEIWRTADGVSWTQVNSDGFGDWDNISADALKAYNGRLYAGVYNSSGAKIFRFSEEEMAWEEVVSDGFGDGKNWSVHLLEEFGGYLYAGTSTAAGGADLWRSETGDTGSWESVMTGGFGDVSNSWIGYQGAVVNGGFWVGTRAASGVGAELWYSSDGESWIQEGEGGFGDTGNYALYTATFKERLYIGFSNEMTGAEVWRSEVLPALSITTETLPSATVGSSYNQRSM